MQQTDTLFAPAQKATPETVDEQRRRLSDSPMMKKAMDALASPVLILNEQRQILYANRAILEMLGIESDVEIAGQRPGEALDCSHAGEGTSGCGTSEACRTCGAVLSILSALGGKESTEECRITQRGTGQAFDLRVKASPLKLAGRPIILFSAHNITDEKRRNILERTFFHDIINSVGGILGAATLLQEDPTGDEVSSFAQLIGQSATEVINEVRSHRELIAAENGHLTLNPQEVKLDELLRDIARLYCRHPVAEGRSLEVEPCGEGFSIYTDRTLLFRILGNMAKNALEASPPGEEVMLGCDRWGDGARLWVRNEGLMPRETQLQVFQRSFSTKGKGRGLGTYSMRLLGERYLGGQVSFSSTKERGTIFWIELPAILVAPAL